MLSAGSAFTPMLTDFCSEAAAATFMHAAEVMQYDLDALRDAIVVYIAEDDLNGTRDNVLVIKVAKHATELVLWV